MEASGLASYAKQTRFRFWGLDLEFCSGKTGLSPLSNLVVLASLRFLAFSLFARAASDARAALTCFFNHRQCPQLSLTDRTAYQFSLRTGTHNSLGPRRSRTVLCDIRTNYTKVSLGRQSTSSANLGLEMPFHFLQRFIFLSSCNRICYL